MQTKIFIYRNGHFYDTDTKERYELSDGAEISVTIANGDFYPAPPAGKLIIPKHSEMLLEEIMDDSDIIEYKKIYDAGQTLYFSISRTEDEQPVSYVFEVVLLEDLYIFRKAKWKQKEGRLYDCACQVIADINNLIEFFEPVFGKSLNEIYKHTFVHYFGNKGNPACNALDRFFEQFGDESTVIGRHRNLEKSILWL